MRTLLALGLLMASAPAGAAPELGDREAAALFQKAEQQLVAAPQLSLRGRIASTGSFEATVDVTLESAPDGRAKFLVQGDLLGRPARLELSSNGKKMKWAGRSEATPPELHRGLVLGLMRVGLLYNLVALATGKPPEGTDGRVEEWLEVGRFALGPREEVEGRATRKIEFTIFIAKEEAGHAELWLDESTGLPCKRAAVVDFQGTMTVVERYPELALTVAKAKGKTKVAPGPRGEAPSGRATERHVR